jgi:LmbE family N-acetylglucosaminyl deacetylase
MNVYQMTTGRRARLLCVFAHPDDEVFCAGGTLARWVAAGGEAMVVSATRGEAGQIQDACVATRRTLGAVRERELRAACAQLGVQRVECLDYQDGALQDVGEATLAREVAARIRDFRPDAIITFGPDGGYGHPDHIAISFATTRACQLVARQGGRVPHLYYSAFPCQHRLLCRWLAHWLTECRPGFHASASTVRALTLLADEATMLRYADDAVETQWFPAGFAMVEQGEPGTSLYLIVAGHAQVMREDADGTQQMCRTLGPGQFFGALALARHQPQEAAVVATDTVTCLVLSSRTPVTFAGRGEEPQLSGSAIGMRADADDEHEREQLIRVDAADHIERKIAALAAHRTQFAIEPALLPAGLLRELLDGEYFTGETRAILAGDRDPLAAGNAPWDGRREMLTIPA